MGETYKLNTVRKIVASEETYKELKSLSMKEGIPMSKIIAIAVASGAVEDAVINKFKVS